MSWPFAANIDRCRLPWLLRSAGTVALALAVNLHTNRTAEASPRGEGKMPIEATAGYTGAATNKEPAKVKPVVPAPPTAAPSEEPANAAEGALSFTLTGIDLDGAKTIEPKVIAALYSDMIGRTVGEKELAAISQAISDLYRAEGYSLSRAFIPPQDIEGGRITVRVVEGAIEEVTFKGAASRDFGVGRVLSEVKNEKPLRQATFERYLLLASDTPGTQITNTNLEEIGEGSGRFRLVVTVKSWDVYVNSGLDNRGTNSVGRVQGYVAPSLNSIARPGDTLGLSLSTIPFETDELQHGRVSYTIPIAPDGTRISMSASHGNIAPGDERRVTGNHTTATRYDIKGTITPLRSQQASLWLSLGFEMSDVAEDDDTGPLRRDHLRVVQASAETEFRDRFGGTNAILASMRKSLDVFDATNIEANTNSRPDATGQFSSLQLFANHLHPIHDNISVNVAAAAQFSTAPVLASEEFYVGGAQFGRAYDSGHIGGDKGVAGSIELRYDRSVEGMPFSGFRLYGFLDGGTVWDLNGGPNEGVSLVSTGAGMKVFFDSGLEGSLEVATPLFDVPESGDVRDVSVYASVARSFRFCPSADGFSCGGP